MAGVYRDRVAIALVKRREPGIVALGQAKFDRIVGVRHLIHRRAHSLKAGETVLLRDVVLGLVEFARTRLREYAPRLVFRLFQHFAVLDQKPRKQRAQKGGYFIAQLFQIVQAIIVHRGQARFHFAFVRRVRNQDAKTGVRQVQQLKMFELFKQRRAVAQNRL